MEKVEEVNKKISVIVSPGLEMELKAIPDTEYYRDISEFLVSESEKSNIYQELAHLPIIYKLF